MKKQGLVLLALVVTTAAIDIFVAPVPRPIDLPAMPAPDAARGPAAGNASLEIRRAPVPLLVKARPPFEQPTFDADAVGPVFVSALSTTASAAVGDNAAKAADTRGANGRFASGQPTAGGTRWAP